MIQLSLENWQTFYAQLDLKSAFKTSFFIDLTSNGTRKQSKHWPPRAGIAALLLGVAEVSEPPPLRVHLSSSEEWSFWPEIQQVELQKSNVTTILFKSSVHGVTWKCHQPVTHSRSS